MPPTRTRDAHESGEPSSSDAVRKAPGRLRPKHRRHEEPATPGVSKLKAALRQTRRLLVKDTLAADVRVSTERRFKSLEADLAKAEKTNKERAMAVRYHKIKFFDRQKIERKIKQTKKVLDDSTLSPKKKNSLESTLFELRVDLNYLTNYPKTEKYISLFPPEIRSEGGAEPVHQPTSMSVTDARREELRKRTRERMKAGEMSMEPEMLQRKTDRRNEGTVVALDADKGKDTTKKKKEKKGGNETGTGKGVLQDDFFEDVDEDEKIENAEDIEMRNHDDNAESDSGSEAKSRTKARAEAGAKHRDKKEKSGTTRKGNERKKATTRGTQRRRPIASEDVDDFFE